MTYQEYYDSLNETYTELKIYLEEIGKNDVSEYADKIDLLKANIKHRMLEIYSEIENVEDNISKNTDYIDLKRFIELSNLKDKIILQYNKLNSILESMFSFEINESKTLISNSYKEATELKSYLKEAEEKQEQLEMQSEKLVQNVIATEEKLKEIEHKTNNNILTFIGIFSSIITIITASISTTNSWLNNSNGSFILALLAPATIIVIAILILFLLVKFVMSDKSPKNRYIIASSVICGILFILTLIFAFCNNPKEKAKTCEESYIIIPIEKVDNDNNEITYIYNGVEFTIDCDYSLLHDDGLHYCPEHNKFE